MSPHSSTSAFSEIYPDFSACAGIIAQFVVGILLVLLFVAWQHYLERRLENPNIPRTRWTAPPLMKPSMWTRAHGRFAVMQIIACVNMAAFGSWLVWVQLYYQMYLDLSPIQTMPRMLPLLVVGIAAVAFIAFAIGRVNVVYIVATGTLMTGCANLLFAVVNPSAPFWAFGFPSACLVALGADFTFAAGTMFVAKVSLPHEQSVAGALFQAMSQLGSAIGVSVSTIVFNGVLRAQSSLLGVTLDAQGDNAPRPAQLKAYKAAMWTGFSFGILCAYCVTAPDRMIVFSNRFPQARSCVSSFCAGWALSGSRLRKIHQLIPSQRPMAQWTQLTTSFFI